LIDLSPETHDARINEQLRLIEPSEPEQTAALPDVGMHELGVGIRSSLQTGAGVLTL
jgi:hypothetical protein